MGNYFFCFFLINRQSESLAQQAYGKSPPWLPTSTPQYCYYGYLYLLYLRGQSIRYTQPESHQSLNTVLFSLKLR